MNYPLISEYVEAIMYAEDNFASLSYLRPVLNDDGMPVMTSGNFAVVFKMKDERDGKCYAVKCFTKEQEGRAEAYHQITEELKNVDSPYLISITYLNKELFVDTSQSTETEFPVLLMDWVDGKTLDKYLRENLDDKYALEMLAYRFSQLAQWLIPQPFAHGDLKPDNILVQDDGSLVLVDYDGMYVPAMKGQKAREIGSPNFRHPQRTEEDFDGHIDDFPLLSILLSLKVISYIPGFYNNQGSYEGLLFTQVDYITGTWCKVIDRCVFYMKGDGYKDDYLLTLAGLFAGLCKYQYKLSIPSMNYPINSDNYSLWGIKGLEFLLPYSFDQLIMEDNDSTPTSIEIVLDGLTDLDFFLRANDIDYVLSGSLGLFLHGFTLSSYIPHDIDIRVRANEQNYTNICNFFAKVMEFCFGKGDNIFDEYNDPMYRYTIKRTNIKINTFISHANYSPEDKYVETLIQGHIIKVHDVLGILKEKYQMGRKKDLLFNFTMQNTMNDMFLSN